MPRFLPPESWARGCFSAKPPQAETVSHEQKDLKILRKILGSVHPHPLNQDLKIVFL